MTRIDFRVHPATAEVIRYRHHGRVLLDGVDVTKNCFLADDETGEVGSYLLNADGRRYHDGTGAASTFRQGVVQILES